MAGGICDTPHDPPVPAKFVGAFLDTGGAVALCDECMVPWSAALLSSMTDMDMTPFFEALQKLDEEAAAAGVPTAAEGAPTDEPPAPAPADADGEETDDVMPLEVFGEGGSDRPPHGAATDDTAEPAPTSNGAPTGDAPSAEAA